MLSRRLIMGAAIAASAIFGLSAATAQAQGRQRFEYWYGLTG